MNFRTIRWIRGAFAVVLAVSGTLTAGAQGRGVPEPYTPAKDAKDLKAVLFNWERNMVFSTRRPRGHDGIANRNGRDVLTLQA